MTDDSADSGTVDSSLAPTSLSSHPPPSGSTRDARVLERGATIGRYVVLELLGRGGMGYVYSAYDPQLDRRVAVKLLRPELLAAAPVEAKARMLREAQSMARLNHPNVVAVYDAQAAENQVFVAMELVEGQTLRDGLGAAPRSVAEIVAVFRDAGQGLAAAHEQGLLHRDVKPDNVLVGNDGRARVTDFGVATMLAEAQSITLPPGAEPVGGDLHSPLTVPGSLAGTPAYMAPERLEGKELDARTDQFSFAVALFEALYRERPFQGETLEQLCTATLSGKIVQVPAGSNVPAWVDRVVRRALSADPNRRYPSMRELLFALGDDPRRRYLRRAVGVTALALLTVVAGTLWARKQREHRACLASAELTGVWDAARRGKVQAAFAATRLPFAEKAFQDTAQHIDMLAEQWTELSRSKCEGRAQQDPILAAREAECLLVRRAELEQLLGMLDSADATVVENAGRVVTALSESKNCRPAVSAPRARSPLTRDAIAQQTLAVRAKLLHSAGKYDAARDAAREVLAKAAPGEASKATVEAWRALAYAQLATSESMLGAGSFLESAWAASVIGDHEAEALARAGRIFALGAYGQTAGDVLKREERELEVAMQKVGHSPDIELAYYWRMSYVRSAQGQNAEAVAMAEKAVELSSGSAFGSDVELINAELALGDSLVAAGLTDRALEVLRRSLERHGRVLGPAHPRTLVVLNNLGTAYSTLHDWKQAFATFDRLLQTIDSEPEPDWDMRLFALINSGESLQRMGKTAEALPRYQRAQQMLEGRPNTDTNLKAEVWAGLGRSLLARHRPEQALPLLEKALEVRRARKGDRLNLGYNLEEVATALWESGGDRTRAVRLAKEALGTFREQPGAAEDVARIERWLAQHAR